MTRRARNAPALLDPVRGADCWVDTVDHPTGTAIGQRECGLPRPPDPPLLATSGTGSPDPVTSGRGIHMLGHMGDETTQTLQVRPWWDPELAVAGFPPNSLYFETYWLPILGPASTLALRELSRGLVEEPGGYEIDPVWLARRLGVGRSRSANGPVARAIDRLCYFGLVRTDTVANALEVRTHAPVLPRHLFRHLPPDLRKSHGRHTGASAGQPAGPTTAPALRPTGSGADQHTPGRRPVRPATTQR